MEVGIEPAAWYTANLRLVSILIEDACGYGNAGVAKRSNVALWSAGDTIIIDVSGLKMALAS